VGICCHNGALCNKIDTRAAIPMTVLEIPGSFLYETRGMISTDGGILDSRVRKLRERPLVIHRGVYCTF